MNNELNPPGSNPEEQEWYHTETIYDEDDEPIGYKCILDENGNKIPLELCICAAHDYSECGCGCTSWNQSSWSDCEDGWYDEEMRWSEHADKSYGGTYYDYF